MPTDCRAEGITMKLGVLERMKVSGGRPLVRRIFRTPWLRESLLRGRASDLAKGLDPDIALILALGEKTGDVEVAGSSPAAARRGMQASIALVEDEPRGDMVVREREIPGPAGDLPARLYEPAGLRAPSAGLVFIHGGGWVTGDLDTHDTLCRRIALEAKIRVIAVCPRLAPEHRFPAAVDDSVAAFRHVAKEAARYGIDPTRLGIGGDSAGGNLSALVGLETRSDAVRPKLALLLYPSVDATCSMKSHTELATGYLLTRASIRWYLSHYLGDHPRSDPRVSPYLAADLRGAPPSLVVVAGFDPLRDEGEAYARRLDEAGVMAEVMMAPSMPHGFALMTGLSPRALADTERFARRVGELLRT